jgi:hypothetical protein
MIARIPAIKGVKYRHNSEGFSLQAGILTTLEPALLLTALCLAALGAYALPGRRGYLGGRRALPLSSETARWHDAGEVESASGGGMRAGIPLERQAAVALGNRTAVEGGAVEVQRAGSRESLATEQRRWDAGVVKTTDVVTYSQDDLAKVSISAVRIGARLTTVDCETELCGQEIAIWCFSPSSYCYYGTRRDVQ